MATGGAPYQGGFNGGLTLPPLPSVRWDTPDAKHARLSQDAPRVPWDKFITKTFEWRQGEHVSLIGATGRGKTTMLMELLPLHPFVAVFATKIKDPTMDKLIAGRNGAAYQRMERWRRLDPYNVPRRVIWPSRTTIKELQTVQQDVFEDAFENIYAEGGWTVAIDELWWYTNILSLGMHIRVLLLQGRSADISMIMSTQKPAFVPTEIYSQSTHLLLWGDNDKRNLDRLGEINARDSSLVRAIVRELEENQVLYINTRTGKMARTHVPSSIAVGR